jgi:cytochrome c-type biogenesis protein CcmH
MIAFWIATALLSAATAVLVIHRAARAASRAAGPDEDATVAVYRRQLAEVDDLAARGLLTDEDYRSTRTEAARRLISAAEPEPRPAKPATDGRTLVLIVAALVPILTLALYLGVGPALKITAPGDPDQPFQRRLAGWRRADPAELDPPRMVAVLQQVVAEHPNDATPLSYLGQAQAAAGDYFSAERSLQKAVKIAPKQADLWTLYGQFIVADQTDQDLPNDARAAFQTALSLDPKAPAPRYFVARAKIAQGDVAGGLADWKALRADLNRDDPRGASLDRDIATVEQTHALPPRSGEPGATPGPVQGAMASAAEGQDQDPKAFIHAMVSQLAARLQANPDNPAGWARLVRSYVVLGDAASRDQALARARTLFKNRPQDLGPIEAAAQ